MQLTERIWVTVTQVMSWLTLSSLHPFDGPGTLQHPLHFPVGPDIMDSGAFTGSNDLTVGNDDRVFEPPTGRPGFEFHCDYRNMKGWRPCSTPANRGCWLRHPNGDEFNILTDYESRAPIGIERNYTLVINDGWINADGRNFTEAKLFNDKYPGPWIQACWGDTVNVKVINNMKHNGTSIHWHGIRQNHTMPMDGVNGITQCPIAPGDHFTYTWKAVQYGSSWYHSHYSVQYADGLQGPLTIHGPDSAPFDEAIPPLIMTDWSHESAFRTIYTQNPNLDNPSILLNGLGNVTRFNTKNPTDSTIPDIYRLHFEKRHIGENGRAKRYMLRLINTSFKTTFIFSIDNHQLQVVDADFVPIEPYFTTSVLVGIGQRYRVIVEARPDEEDDGSNPIPKDNNFWIRTFVANGCGQAGEAGYERTGILRYDASSKPANVTSKPWRGMPMACSDEPYENLKPMHAWTVGSPSNTDDGELFRVESNITGIPGQPQDPKPGNRPYPLANFALEPETATISAFTPLQINYSDPILMHLSDFSGNWQHNWVVVPENFKSTDWVYLVLTGNKAGFTVSAHPIHLHGHDFAILQQSNAPYSPEKLQLNLANPPRRDVVLLPNGGFVVIAFKADNPGSWLLHCHIATHASEGLALQILERQADANKLYLPSSPAMLEAGRICTNWDKWVSDCHNWASGCDAAHIFQDDSGI